MAGQLAMLLRFVLRRFYLLFFLIRSHFWRNLVASLGLFITLLVVISILGVLRPLKEQLLKKVETSLPGETIRATERSKSSAAALPFNLFGGDSLSDKVIGVTGKKIKKIRSWDEVSSITYTQVLQRPAMAEIDHPIFSSLGLRSDMMLQGISANLAKPYLKCMKNFKPVKKDGELMLPLVIPQSFAEIAYAYGMINNLPILKPADIIGLKLKLILGRSIIGTKAGPLEEIKGTICGFVPNSYLAAVGVPVTYTQRAQNKLGQRVAADSYDQIFVTVKDASQVKLVQGRMAKMGLSFPKSKEKYGRMFKILDQLDLAVWSLAALLLTLTGISLFNSYTLLAGEKRYEFGLYLVFGSSASFLWFLMFIEGAFFGFLQGVSAIVAADWLLSQLNAVAGGLPWLTDLASMEQISLGLETSEKALLLLACSVFAGIASFLPTLLLTFRRTLELVRRD